jgi:uncharacterized protein
LGHVVAVLMALVMAQGVSQGGPQAVLDEGTHRREIEAWRAGREQRLTADGGWLTVSGLFWLRPGANSFGADAGNVIVLPAHSAPARAGRFVLEGRQVTAEVLPGVTVTLAGKPVTRAPLSPGGGGTAPDVLALGDLTLQIIERGERLGVRLKDNRSEARRRFKGLRYFPIRSSFRVTARFVAHPKPVTLTVPSTIDQPQQLPSPGRAEFELAGKKLRLDAALEDGEKQLMFIFRDGTSGKSSYGAGRFLYTDLPKDSKVVLDFNKAYSPPCAFTAHATCPLPPPQNHLPVAVEAGEMYDGH